MQLAIPALSGADIVADTGGVGTELIAAIAGAAGVGVADVSYSSIRTNTTTATTSTTTIDDGQQRPSRLDAPPAAVGCASISRAVATGTTVMTLVTLSVRCTDASGGRCSVDILAGLSSLYVANGAAITLQRLFVLINACSNSSFRAADAVANQPRPLLKDVSTLAAPIAQSNSVALGLGLGVAAALLLVCVALTVYRFKSSGCSCCRPEYCGCCCRRARPQERLGLRTGGTSTRD